MKRSLSVFIWLVMAVWVTGCQQETEQPKTISDIARPAKVLEIRSGAASLERRFPGKVAAANAVQLAFRVPGELDQLPAMAGQQVKQGDLLASLDPKDYQLAVNERSARLDLARSQFERIDNLYQRDQVSRSNYDQAKAELNIAKAAYDSANSDLGYTRLLSPFDGQIAQVYVENYQTVAAGNPVLKLQTSDVLDVIIQVPEQLMIHLSRSDNQYRPDIEFDALPGQRFQAQYQQHNAEADPATGSYEIKLRLKRPPGFTPLPGMSASVYASMQDLMGLTGDAIVIPVEAVFQHVDQAEGSSQASVWKLTDDNRLQRQPVVTGRMTQSGMEIREGLQPGDRILEAGVHQARDGMKVKPWQQERGL